MSIDDMLDAFEAAVRGHRILDVPETRAALLSEVHSLEARAESAERGILEHEESWARVFSICLPITGTADSTTVGMVRRLEAMYRHATVACHDCGGKREITYGTADGLKCRPCPACRGRP